MSLVSGFKDYFVEPADLPNAVLYSNIIANKVDDIPGTIDGPISDNMRISLMREKGSKLYTIYFSHDGISGSFKPAGQTTNSNKLKLLFYLTKIKNRTRMTQIKRICTDKISSMLFTGFSCYFMVSNINYNLFCAEI